MYYDQRDRISEWQKRIGQTSQNGLHFQSYKLYVSRGG
jgi:hypothetical protein